MAVRLLSSAVSIVIAVIILILHNTIALNIAIALISVVMVYEVLKAARCTQLRLTCIPALLYAAVNPFIVTGERRKIQIYCYFLLR